MRSPRLILTLLFTLALTGLLVGPSVRPVAAQMGFLDPAAVRQAHFEAAISGQPISRAAAAIHGATPALPLAAPNVPADALDWSTLSFQAWADNSYEIFSMDGHGQNLARLTQNPANDGRARLNPSATALVFTSNRDGDFEIFSMAVDGSGVRQLTSNSASDAAPCWSPDGSQVAFVSNLSGTYELYRMQADGSGLTRLTFFNNGDVLYPAWAPNGSQIAFTLWPSQNYVGKIYTIAPDGSGQQIYRTMTSSLVEHLTWSPDGARLYWDAFDQYYPFNRIYFTDSTTSSYNSISYTPLTTYEDQLVGDALVSTSAFTGHEILLVRILYGVQNNQLVLDHSQLELCPTYPTYQANCTQTLATGLVFFPDRQSRDLQPPLTRLQPLPEYSRRFGFPLRWTVENPGPAPLAGFEFQASNQNYPGYFGGGDFRPDVGWPLSTSGFFTPSNWVNEVFFFVRGWDAADNYGAFPASPANNGSTKIFNTYLGGRLLDPRGRPLIHQPVTDYSPVTTPVLTDDRGAFLLRTQNNYGWYLNPPLFGFGKLPSTQFSTRFDLMQDLVYPPLDNLLQNGTFETPDLSGWSPFGSSLPTISSAQRVTGTRSASLGGCSGICLAEPQPTGLSGNRAALAAGPAGELSALAYTPGAGIYAADRPSAGSWSAPQQLANLSGSSVNWEVDLLRDPHGGLQAVWFETSGGFSARRPAGGGWSAPVALPAGGSLLARAVDDSGRLHLLLLRGPNLEYQKQLLGGAWSAPLVVNPNLAAPITASLLVDAGGTVHLLWAATDLLVYRSLAANGSLSQIIPLFIAGSSETLNTSFPPPLAFDAGGILNAVFGGSLGLHACSLAPGDQWTCDRLVNTFEGSPRLWPAADGALYLTLANTYLERSNHGAWTTPRTFTGGAVVVVDALGQQHILQVDATEQLLYRGPYLPAFEGFSTLEQLVTLPADLQHATLSFVYQLRTPGLNPHSFLRVEVLDSQSQLHTLAELRGATYWRPAWVDLEAWAGQTIGLRISLVQAAGEPLAQVDLDDVSLGSWWTPVITSASPSGVAIGPQQAITLHGDNFANLPAIWLDEVQLPDSAIQWLDEHTLVIQPNRPLVQGCHPLRLVTPEGRSTVAPCALRQGYQFSLPLVRR